MSGAVAPSLDDYAGALEPGFAFERLAHDELHMVIPQASDLRIVQP